MQKKIKKFIPKVIGWRLNLLYKVQPDNALQRLYQLFCEPRKGKLQLSELPSFLRNAERKTLKIEKNNIMTYHWKNSGKKILLVHGWESNSSRWEEVVKRLHSLGYELIAFDAPAHGLSGGNELHVPLFAKCVTAVQDEYHAHFAIGHSAGAMSLVYQAYAFPETQDFEKLVLLGSPSEMTKIINDMAHILRLKHKVVQDLDQFFKQKFGFYFDEFSIAKFAKILKTPSLVIHDKYDRVAPVEAAHAIAGNLENSQMVITEGQGHSLNRRSVIDRYIDFIHSSKSVVNE